MSRDAELERILQAWFDWESCSAAAKNQYRDAFHRLLDEARAGSNVSRQDLIVALPTATGNSGRRRKRKSEPDSPGCVDVQETRPGSCGLGIRCAVG